MLAKRSFRNAAPAVLAIAMLAGCGASSSDTSAGTATSATPSVPSATAMPTLEPAPPVIALTLPQQPIPNGVLPPITVRTTQAQTMQIKGVANMQLPCFQTLTPGTTFAKGGGCNLTLQDEPNSPYFKAQAIADKSPTLDALQTELLAGLAVADARTEASGSYVERMNLARRGKLGTIQGRYLGSRSTTIFGQPARIVAWGYFDQLKPGKPNTQYVDIITMLPRGRYVINGAPITALLVQGYTAGYKPKRFNFALSHLQMR